MAGDVGDVVGAGGGRAAERARAEVAGLVAVEGDAGVLEPQDLVGRLAAHDLDRVLVAQVVRALDRVERVRLPAVLGVERRVDPAGGRDRVRADGMDLRDDRHRRAGLGRGQRGPLAGEAGTDDQHVVRGHAHRILFGGTGRRFLGRRAGRPHGFSGPDDAGRLGQRQLPGAGEAVADVRVVQRYLAAAELKRAIGGLDHPHDAPSERVWNSIECAYAARVHEVLELEPERLVGLELGREDVAAAVGEVILAERLRVLVDDAAVEDPDRLARRRRRR